MKATNNSPKGAIVDIDAAAAILGTTPRWMRRAVYENRIAYIKIGRLVRFDTDDLDRYLASQKVPARADA